MSAYALKELSQEFARRVFPPLCNSQAGAERCSYIGITAISKPTHANPSVRLPALTHLPIRFDKIIAKIKEYNEVAGREELNRINEETSIDTR